MFYSREHELTTMNIKRAEKGYPFSARFAILYDCVGTGGYRIRPYGNCLFAGRLPKTTAPTYANYLRQVH